MSEFWWGKHQQSTALGEIVNLVAEYPIDTIKFNFDLRVYFYLENINNLPVEIRKSVIWLGTCHYNGYEREKYLDAIIIDFEAQDVNRILHRLLDWVLPIREKADTWLFNHLEAIPVEFFIDNLLILQKIINSDKADTLQSLSLIDDYIWNYYQDNFPRSIKKLQFYQRSYLYYIAKQQLKQSRIYIDSLLRDRDPQLRNQIFVEITDDYFREILPRLIKDKSARIRYNALKKIVSIDPYDYHEIFIQVLTDKSQQIRNYAQFYLNKLWGIDLYSFYKTHFTDHDLYPLFLADFAKPEDYNFLYTILLSSSSNIVKYYCLLALTKMDKLEHIKLIFFELLPLNNKIKRLLEKLIFKLFSVSEMLNHQNKFIETGISPQRYCQFLYQKSIYIGLNESLKFANNEVISCQQTIALLNQYIIKNAELYQHLPTESLGQEITENWKLFNQKFSHQIDPNLNKELTFIFKTDLL